MIHISGAMKLVSVLAAGAVLTACTTIADRVGNSPRATAEQYFEVYAERTDFEQFMSFYAEDAVLEDLIYGHLAQGKSNIRAFLNWNDGKFSLANGETALELDSLHIDGQHAYARGRFNPFNYAGKPHGPWRFLIALEFNKKGQIVRHVDWINYTPKDNFLGGEDFTSELQNHFLKQCAEQLDKEVEEFQRVAAEKEEALKNLEADSKRQLEAATDQFEFTIQC